MQHLMMLNVISINCFWIQVMLTEYDATKSEKIICQFVWNVLWMNFMAIKVLLLWFMLFLHKCSVVFVSVLFICNH